MAPKADRKVVDRYLRRVARQARKARKAVRKQARKGEQ